MGRKRRRNAPSGAQVIQVQQMVQDLLLGLDTAGVQRILDAREVLAAIADARLTPQKALASLGVPVTLAPDEVVTMDFFGFGKDADREDALAAFRRQGLRPATDDEYRKFADQHPEALHGLLVRSRLSMVVMGRKFRVPTRDPRQTCWGFPVYSRNRDGVIERYVETAEGAWDRSHRFLGVRTDLQADLAAIPVISARHVSPKVRPQA